jgi:hypothetical protein
MNPKFDRFELVKIPEFKEIQILFLSVRVALIEIAIETTPTVFAIAVETTFSEKVENLMEIGLWAVCYILVLICLFFKNKDKNI